MIISNKIIKFIPKQINDIKTYGILELLKKIYLLIRILFQLPGIIIAIIPCVLIRIISLFIIVRVQKIPSKNFGDFLIFVSIYYCKKKLNIDQPKKKCIDLLYIHHKDKTYNKQLEKMWRRRMIFFSSYLLDPIYKANKIFPGWKKHTIEILSTKLEYDVDNLVERYRPLDFTEEEEVFGQKILSQFGLKNTDKFVCLAVRDGTYNKVKDPSNLIDYSYHDYRNHDIDNFKLASEELAKKGYFVFRMGVTTAKPFNINNPKIIDYANSNLRSDFMDIYLGAKCSFCFSTGYGYDQVPYVFGRPIALASLPLGDLRTHSKKFLLLTKHHFLKEKKRKLSMSEIFTYGLAYAYDSRIFKEKGVELIDYKPEEIKDFVLEMSNNLDFKELDKEDEKLQENFKNLFSLNIKKTNYSSQVKTPYYKLQGKIKSRFSTKFLRENKNWLQ